MSNAVEKTHYRKAFKSPYLSSADIVEPTVLTIASVRLMPDQTHKTKDMFNTASFVEKEIRRGEPLKPMILNAGNSQTMRLLTGSSFIEDWQNVRITVFVDTNVRFGRETVEGLRISTQAPKVEKEQLNKDSECWDRAVNAVKAGNLNKVTSTMIVSDAVLEELKEAAGVS